MNWPKMPDLVGAIFDTQNPDNSLGPVLLAIIIALVATVVAAAIGMTHH